MAQFKHPGLDVMGMPKGQFDQMDQEQLMAASAKLSQLAREVREHGEMVQGVLGQRVEEDRARAKLNQMSDSEKDMMRKVMEEA